MTFDRGAHSTYWVGNQSEPHVFCTLRVHSYGVMARKWQLLGHDVNDLQTESYQVYESVTTE